jgi:hypothetical protein
MRTRQKGVTMIGWLILLTPFAIVIYAGIRVLPMYLNYMKVARTLDALPADLKSGSINPNTIETSIGRHFEIDMVDYPTMKDVKISKADGGGWLVQSLYEDQAPLLANISIHIVFDKSITVGGQ